VRVSKGGQLTGLRPILRDAVLRTAPQDEVIEGVTMSDPLKVFWQPG
jgi:hypothetical protein